MTGMQMIGNWKLAIHLVFRTKRFGVNNEWWSEWDSVFGRSWAWRLRAVLTVKPLLNEINMALFRVYACHFLAGGRGEKLTVFGRSLHPLFFFYRRRANYTERFKRGKER